MSSDVQHPELLRPGNSETSGFILPSPSPPPDERSDQGMSRKPVAYRPASNGGNGPQYQPQQQAPVPNYSTRFPSAAYPQEKDAANYPAAPQNPFSDANSRSRSSTLQTSPNRQPQAVGLAPSAYPGRPSSSSVNSNNAPIVNHPSSPTMNHQSLYSRPTTATSATASNPRLAKTTSSTQQTSQSGQFTTPISAPIPARPIQILLINPNSTRSMTDACLAAIRPRLPPNVEVTGYTAPHPAPSAIESTTDAILSAETCIRDLHLSSASNNETIRNFDGFLVACFSKHPLIDALRELYDVPCIGIMEASLYIARSLGGRFGIVATSRRAKILHDDAVAAYGLSHFSVGSEATGLGVLELDSRPREDVAKRVGHCARALVHKGADVVILGCAGMSELGRAAKDAVRDEDGRRLVNVIDGVEAGVWVLHGLCGMGTPTSKKGVYSGSHEVRRARGQDWL